MKKRPNTSALSSRYAITSKQLSENHSSTVNSSMLDTSRERISTVNQTLTTDVTRPSTSQVLGREKNNRRRARTPGLKTKDPKRVRRIFTEKVTNKNVDLSDYHTAASDWTITLNEKGKKPIVKMCQQDEISGQRPASPIVACGGKDVKDFHNKSQVTFRDHERRSTTGKRPITPFPLRPLTFSERTPRRGPSRPVSPVKPAQECREEHQEHANAEDIALPARGTIGSSQKKIEGVIEVEMMKMRMRMRADS